MSIPGYRYNTEYGQNRPAQSGPGVAQNPTNPGNPMLTGTSLTRDTSNHSANHYRKGDNKTSQA